MALAFTHRRLLLQGASLGLNSVIVSSAAQLQQLRGNLVPVSRRAACRRSGSVAPPCAHTSSMLFQVVIESTSRGERAFDIYSRLLRERIVCVNGCVLARIAAMYAVPARFLPNPITP